MIKATVILLLISEALFRGPWLGAQDTPGLAQVQGHVYDSTGHPIPAATVVIFPMDVGTTGILPSAMTNSDGAYKLELPLYGRVRFYAMKLSAGYPDVSSAIFAPDDLKVTEIDVSLMKVYDGVDIWAGSPDGSVKGVVTDSLTGKPVSTARILISRAENPNIKFSTNIRRDGTFEYFLPKRPLTIAVIAPGYRSWQYMDKTTKSNAITLAPGSDQTIDVLLVPDDTKN